MAYGIFDVREVKLWAPKPTDGETDEIANLKGFFAIMKKQNIISEEKTDMEIKQMAAELNEAANRALKLVEENASGSSNKKEEAKGRRLG